jgi:hypothetical protein
LARSLERSIATFMASAAIGRHGVFSSLHAIPLWQVRSILEHFQQKLEAFALAKRRHNKSLEQVR